MRPPPRASAFVRVESAGGERFEMNCGHLGLLDYYEGDKGKVYPFRLMDSHSGGFTWSSPRAKDSKGD